MLFHQKTIFIIVVSCRSFPIENVNYTLALPPSTLTLADSINVS